MSLQFILGSSGAGKTTCLYDRIIRSSMDYPEQLYFVIVPEQFTMQTQKDIVKLHPCHGTMNIDIVSFQRLAYRVFEELAVENLQVLDDMGKSMVLRKVAAARKKNLVLFQGHLNQTGFVNQLKSMLSEFYQYGITPAVLREMAALAGTPLFRQKLEDFALVFEGFQEYIEGHYITTEEVLDVLCRVLPRSEMVKNSVIALDGYTGFTPVQYRILELFLVHARQVVVTVTADRSVNLYRQLGMQNLFYMSSQVVRRLSELAEKNQVGKLPDLWPDGDGGTVPPRFRESPELAWLERNLFRYRREPYPYLEEDVAGGEKHRFPGTDGLTGENSRTGKGGLGGKGGLELFQGANPAGEIAYVIHRMQELIRRDGLRYRDMAVVTGDLNGYGKEIAHQFEQNGIPYFMDDKKTLLDNPMVELIRGALETVQRDFSYESVLRVLRTGLVTEDREMVDRLENYVIALGIRGYRRFRETWEASYREIADWNLAELNVFRDQTLEPLFAFREAFAGKSLTVAHMTEAVEQLLETCQVEEKLAACRDRFAGEGEYRLSREYGQVYGRVRELLGRLKDLLGEETVSRKEFMEILDAGFGEITVGVIPATVDRVVVGDITRTRLAHIEVLFFVGVNDGIVPMKKDGGSLLSDPEREFFGKHQRELAPTAREDSFIQRFYLYLMMTKPSRRLILTYANVGGDGKGRRPSYLIGELKKIFPRLVCREEGQEKSGDIYSVEEARQRLTAGLRRFRDQPGAVLRPGREAAGESDGKAAGPDGEATELPLDSEETRQFLELFRWFMSADGHREEALRLAEAAFYVYEERGIGHAVARALYGNIISGSVTRLEQYEACAYAHFLQYGLELAERRRYELAAADIGNLFHNSIDLCFKKMKEENRSWREIPDEERNRLVHDCVAAVTGEYGNTILSSTSRNAYLARRVEQITQRTVWALQQQLRRGDFEPAGFEVSFSAADNLKAMRISLSEDEAIHLRGRIDRVDLCEDGGQVYVKIIDYKSGSTAFDLAAVYYGLQLQLVVYMDAVMEMTSRRYPGKEIVPAGLLYYNIADPMVNRGDSTRPDTVEGEILRQLRMNGLVNSEWEAIHHLDMSIEKESDIIPVVLKDGEVQEGRSSVANREHFRGLSHHVHEQVKAAGREILDGSIGVRPYKSGSFTACAYCPYHGVCGFDRKTAGYEYRRLRSRKAEEIWEEICQQNP